MHLGAAAFAGVADRQAAKQLFAASVARVEVETHSYCNRRCSYCPNVVGDRLGENVRLADRTWRMVLSDLAEIGFRQNLVLNSYNEPLADRAILDRIREARAALPEARIMLYTNGDYLDPGYVEALAEAGLSYMHVSIHMRKDDRYSDIYAVNRMLEISVRMGIAARIGTVRANEYMLARVPHPRIEIEMRAINFMKHGTDRGGLMEEIRPPAPRTAPCYFPFSHFVVGFNGNVVPCCHIRADRPEHAGYVTGNLAEAGSIFQAYAGRNAAAWRRELVSALPKRRPCDSCSVGFLEGPKAAAAFDRAWRTHVAPSAAALTPAAAPAP
jgi:MoaA/NifB/PqqE/SkfB family radical SAM enzyme